MKYSWGVGACTKLTSPRMAKVIVDAAAERPDVPNPYLAQGVDAVCYSGGKCMRGPQVTDRARQQPW